MAEDRSTQVVEGMSASIARAGGAGVIITLILAIGMLVTIGSLNAAAKQQITRVRQEEQRMTSVQRLRWSGELIISAGRGYLLAEDARLLLRLQDARSEFDRAIEALLGATPENTDLAAHVKDVADRGHIFASAQDELVDARASTSLSEAITRFERDLLPLQSEFSASLDRLVADLDQVIAGLYGEAEASRKALVTRMYLLLGLLLALSAVVVVWSFRATARANAKERRALNRAHQAIAARDDFIGVASHDLRSPLHALSLRAQILLKISKVPEIVDQAQAMVGIAKRMETLIARLLDVSTIEAGRFSIAATPCYVQELLFDCTETFQPVAAAKNITVRTSIDDSHASVLADRERVLQLLANLLSNALKHTSAGGHVEIAVVRKDAFAEIAVADSGVGIAPAHLPHLFDRFWRAGRSSKESTGLGLFIARGIAEAHGGRIWAENRPGSGATFRFTLPLAATAASNPHSMLDERNRGAEVIHDLNLDHARGSA